MCIAEQGCMGNLDFSGLFEAQHIFYLRYLVHKNKVKGNLNNIPPKTLFKEE